MGRFLIWLSGADKPTLARCPSERTKFIGIGGAVLTTAVMAGGAAMLTLRMAVRAPLPASIIVGVLWGLAILNLDRWLVASTHRQETKRQTVMVFLPRIALALIIGTVISEPLVLRVFQPEIEAELKVMQVEENIANQKALDKDPRYTALPTMEKRIRTLEATVAGGTDSAAVTNDAQVKELTTQVAAKQAEYDEADQAVICEKEGTCGSGKVGAGPAYQEKVERRNRLSGELGALQQQLQARKDAIGLEQLSSGGTQREQAEQELAKLQKDFDARTAEVEVKRKQFESQNVDASGLLARMEALDRLSEQSASLNAARWMLRLFIIAIDCLPVLVKMLMAFGKPSLYDIELELTERQAETISSDYLRDEYEVHQLETSVAVDQARIRHQLEMSSQAALAQKIVDAQTELAEVIIGEWKVRQEALIAANIDDFIEQDIHLP